MAKEPTFESCLEEFIDAAISAATGGGMPLVIAPAVVWQLCENIRQPGHGLDRIDLGTVYQKDQMLHAHHQRLGQKPQLTESKSDS